MEGGPHSRQSRGRGAGVGVVLVGVLGLELGARHRDYIRH